jgi:hypothetical protein
MEPITDIREIKGQFQSETRNKNGDQVFTFVASTDTPDRHGTVLNQNNWNLDNFNANPIIGYQHNVYGGNFCESPNPDDVIGRGHAYVSGEKAAGEKSKLMVDVVFDSENELAMKIKSKIERGFLRTVSVGFMEVGDGHNGNEDDGEDPNLYYFHGQELLELSVVNIPSNPDAKKKIIRSQTYDALRYIYKELGGKYRFSDIENMRVGEIINLLEGKEPETLNEDRQDNTATIRHITYEIIK